VKKMKKALVLCCHGIFHPKGYFVADPRYIDRESPPLELDKVAVYFEQMMATAHLLRNGAYDRLIVSGGHTKPTIAPDLNEAESYWEIMRYLFSKSETNRVFLDCISRDSFENILFSMIKFYRYEGEFPGILDVMTWNFKKERLQIILDTLRIKGHAIGVGEIEGYPSKTSAQIADEIRHDPLHRTRDFAEKRKERTIADFSPFDWICYDEAGLPPSAGIMKMLEVLEQMEKDNNPQLPPGFKFPWEK